METKITSFTPLNTPRWPETDVGHELRRLLLNVHSAVHWLQCAEQELRVSLDKLHRGIESLPEYMGTMKGSDLVSASEKKPTEAKD